MSPSLARRSLIANCKSPIVAGTAGVFLRKIPFVHRAIMNNKYTKEGKSQENFELRMYNLELGLRLPSPSCA